MRSNYNRQETFMQSFKQLINVQQSKNNFNAQFANEPTLP